MPHEPIEIALQGTFYEMGQQYVSKLNQIILDQLVLFRQNLKPINSENQSAFDVQLAQFIQTQGHSYCKEIIDFFNGAVNSEFGKANNLTLEDMVYLDNAYLIAIMAFRFENPLHTSATEHCSFFGIVNEKGIVGGRNFDLVKHQLHCMTAYPVILTMQHSDSSTYPNKVLSIGVAGSVCNPTILNDKNLFLEINSASECTDAKIDFTRLSITGEMLLCMMTCQNYQALHDWCLNKPALMGFNVSIAGAESKELHTIEMSPFNVESNKQSAVTVPNFKNRERTPTSTDTLEPQDWDNNPSLLVSTNLFRLTDWPKFLGHSLPKESSTGFSTERYKNLVKLGRGVQDKLSEKPLNAIQKIMEYGINNNDPVPGVTKYVPSTDLTHDSLSATYYTVAFKTHKQKQPKLSVRFQQQKTPISDGVWTEWKKYKL